MTRRLGFWDSVAINVGVIIGVGIFRTPGTVAQHLNSPSLILFTWALGGLVALIGALCYAELSSCFPETGGTYVYLREAFGKPVGFLFGWAELAIMRPGSIAGVAYIFTSYLGHFFPFAAGHEKIMTIFAILFFTALNVAGLHVGTRVQNVLTLLKVTSILVMAGLIFGIKGWHVPLSFGASPGGFGRMAGSAPALIPVLWTYGGWHQSPFMSGEFRDTKKDLPLSLMTGILIVGGVYLLINAAYLNVLSPSQMVQSKAVASDIFFSLFGPTGMVLVTAAVLISASGALNSTILTGARIPFAVACDTPKFSWFAKIDERYQTPLRSFVLNGLWASTLVLWGNFDQLVFFFAFANWFFFALAGISVFRLRRKASSPDSFAMAGYPWIPILFVLSSLALCGITIQSAPRESLFGALLLLTGLPVYFLFRQNNRI